MVKFIDLVYVLQKLHNEHNISVEELAITSGLPERDVKSVIRKGEKLIRSKREDAIRRLKPVLALYVGQKQSDEPENYPADVV
jgi:hypothetical protein